MVFTACAGRCQMAYCIELCVNLSIFQKGKSVVAIQVLRNFAVMIMCRLFRHGIACLEISRENGLPG